MSSEGMETCECVFDKRLCSYASVSENTLYACALSQYCDIVLTAK